MLVFCEWEERCSLLIDAPSEAKALEMAKAITDEEGDGAGAPKRLVVLPPGAFVAELIDEGEEGIRVEPLPHVADLLVALEDGEPIAPAPEPVPPCGASARAPDKTIVRCIRDKGHPADLGGKEGHKAIGGLVW